MTRTGDTAKGETVKRRKEPDYCKWENSDSAAKQGPGSAEPGMRCFYTNANSMLNKLDELC